MKLISFEFKARLRDEAPIRRALKRLRARYLGEDHQIDTYFKVARGRLKLREGKIENALIFYNRANAPRARRSTVEMTLLPRRNSVKQVLSRVLETLAVVDKCREIYFVGTVKIHLDRVPGLGMFVEVEAISRSGRIARARRLASRFRKMFRIPAANLVGESYSDLVLQKLRR
ncbi:MAG: class IV adenylate cyclase [Acidobacteria bacterium]|nr:class IV adenylate cyclase [Acidobacteriota bacterium]